MSFTIKTKKYLNHILKLKTAKTYETAYVFQSLLQELLVNVCSTAYIIHFFFRIIVLVIVFLTDSDCHQIVSNLSTCRLKFIRTKIKEVKKTFSFLHKN